MGFSKKTWAIFLIVASMVNLFSSLITAAPLEKVFIEADFNKFEGSSEENIEIENWTISGFNKSLRYALGEIVPPKADKSLKLVSKETGELALYRGFTGSNSIKVPTVTLEANMMMADKNTARFIGFRTDAKASYAKVEFKKGGELSVAKADYKTTYEERKWYNVKMTVNLIEGHFSVVINGEEVAKNVPVDNLEGRITAFKIVQLGTDETEAAMHIDDVKIYNNDGSALLAPESTYPPITSAPVLSDALKKKLDNSICLYVDSAAAYVKNSLTRVDKDNIDVKPVIIEGRTLVPVRFIAESLGANVGWDGQTSTVTINLNSQTIKMVLGEKRIDASGTVVGLDVPAQTINGRTMIPLRAMAEAVGKHVFWDARGLIVISDHKDLFDANADAEMITETVYLLAYERPQATEIITRLKERNPNNKHPRLWLNAEDFENLKNKVETDPTFIKWFEILKNDTETTLTMERSMYQERVGTALLYRWIMQLITCYKLTGEEKYAKRAYEILSSAAEFNFDDHPLRVGSDTKSYALAYDWLYDYWTEEQKEVLRKYMQERMEWSISWYRNPTTRWVMGDTNWNAIANSGLMMSAIALGEENEVLCGEVLESSLRSCEYLLPEFGPDGGWHEGVYYWFHMVDGMVPYLQSLYTSLGTDYGLFNAPGMKEMIYFPVHMTGINGGPYEYFNFGDTEANRTNRSYNLPPQMFWFAQRFNDPFLGGMRMKILEEGRVNPTGEDLLLFNEAFVDLDSSAPPLDRYFKNIETASFRGSWQDPQALYLGFHLGANTGSHKHLDVGTFAIDALGERWAWDLGLDQYELPGYFNYDKNMGEYLGQRWSYYRTRAEGHNSLVMNPDGLPDQNVLGSGRIEKFETKTDGGFAIADMTNAYDRHATDAKRGVMLADNRGKIVIRDEIKFIKPSELYWFMHTKAEIELVDQGKAAILKIGEKRLWVGIDTSGDAVFSVMDPAPMPTSPTGEGQNENKGVKKLAVNLKGKSNVDLQVQFIPLKDGETTPVTKLPDMPLSSWSIKGE